MWMIFKVLSSGFQPACQRTPFSLCTTNPEHCKPPCLHKFSNITSLQSFHWLFVAAGAVSNTKPGADICTLSSVSSPARHLTALLNKVLKFFAKKKKAITCSILFLPYGYEMVTWLSHSLFVVEGFKEFFFLSFVHISCC